LGARVPAALALYCEERNNISTIPINGTILRDDDAIKRMGSSDMRKVPYSEGSVRQTPALTVFLPSHRINLFLFGPSFHMSRIQAAFVILAGRIGGNKNVANLSGLYPG
jgi:hypothetical protein